MSAMHNVESVCCNKTRFEHNIINMSEGAYKVAMGLNKGTIVEMDAHIGDAQ